jgi:hypothetical protein
MPASCRNVAPIRGYPSGNACLRTEGLGNRQIRSAEAMTKVEVSITIGKVSAVPRFFHLPGRHPLLTKSEPQDMKASLGMGRKLLN